MKRKVYVTDEMRVTLSRVFEIARSTYAEIDKASLEDCAKRLGLWNGGYEVMGK